MEGNSALNVPEGPFISPGDLRTSSLCYSSAVSCCHLPGLNDAMPWPDISALGSDNPSSLVDTTAVSIRRCNTENNLQLLADVAHFIVHMPYVAQVRGGGALFTFFPHER